MKLMAACRRLSIVISVIVIAWACSTLHAQASEGRIRFAIKAQPLAGALLEFGAQAGIAIAFVERDFKGLQFTGLAGEYTSHDALALLLKDTGFREEFVDARTVRIVTDRVERPANPAKAPPASGSPQADSATNAEPEEVVVTAQKRKQNLYSVPLAVTALTGEALEIRGISNAVVLQVEVPNLTIGQRATSNGSANVTLRGVGMEDDDTHGEPSVPVHVDGHYIPAPYFLFRDFLDLERVEVLRGPQGTLYGRNAIGGNINLITKRPTDHFEGRLAADLGNYDKRLVQGVVSGPISDRLRARLAVADESRAGYVRNISPLAREPDYQNADWISTRASLEYDVTAALQATASAYYYDDRSRKAVYFTKGSDTSIYPPSPYQASLNDPHVQRDKGVGGSLDFDWQLGSLELRSLSAYNHLDKSHSFDFDSTAVTSSPAKLVRNFETYSQEFQLLSQRASRLKWVAGIYYYSQAIRGGFPYIVVPPSTVRFETHDDDASSRGVYGQADYSLSSRLELTVGARYTSDKKHAFDLAERYIGGSLSSRTIFSQRLSSSQPTWKLGLNYQWRPDVMAYLTYSTGYKAGGVYNTHPYDPEFLASYEAGLKGQLLDSRVQLALAAFYYDYTDQQQQIRVSLQDDGRLDNAASSMVKGVEAEIHVRPLHSLSLDAMATWQDARFRKYRTLDPQFPALGIQDLAGRRLPYSSDWRFYFGAQYDWSLGGAGSISLRGDYSWVGDQDSRSFNYAAGLVPAYHRANAQLSWADAAARWDVALHVENLDDSVARTSQFLRNTPDFWVDSYLPPRTYGVKLTRKF